MSARFIRGKKNKAKESEGFDVPSSAQVLMEVDSGSRVITRRELEQENLETKRLLIELTSEKESLEAKMKDMPTKDEFEEQRARYETLELDYRDKLRTLEDELEQVKIQSKAELDDLQSEIDADQSHHARMQSELTTELEETKRKLRKKVREVTKVKETNDILREKLKSSVNRQAEITLSEPPSENKEIEMSFADKFKALEEETNQLRAQLAEGKALYEKSQESGYRVKELEIQLHDQETDHITALNNLAVKHRGELAAKDKGIASLWEAQMEESLNKVFVQFEEKEKRLHRVIKERDDQLVKLRQEMLNQCEELGKLLEKERHISKDILQKWDDYRKENEKRQGKDLSPSPAPLERPSGRSEGRSQSQTNVIEDEIITRRTSASCSSRPPPPDFRAPRRTKFQDIGKNLWSKLATVDSRQNNFAVGKLPNGPRHRIMQLMIRQTELEQSLLIAQRNVVLVNERSNSKTRALELSAIKEQGNQEREILRVKTQLQLQQRATKAQEAAVQNSLSEQRMLREMLLDVESQVEMFKRKLRVQTASIQKLTEENIDLKQHVNLSQGDFVAKENVMLQAHAEVERLKLELDETRNNYKTIQGRQVLKNLEAEKKEIAINRNRSLEKEVRHLRAKNKDLKVKLQKLNLSKSQKEKSALVGRNKKVNKRPTTRVEEEVEPDMESHMTPARAIVIEAKSEQLPPESVNFHLPTETRSRRGDFEEEDAEQEIQKEDMMDGLETLEPEEIYRSENSADELRGRCEAVIREHEGTEV